MSTLRSPVRSLHVPSLPSHPLTLITSDWTLVIPPDAHTMEGFRKWATADDFPEHVRVTFLQGEIIIDMSNEELETHNKVKLEISRVLSNLLIENGAGELYADGVLVTNPAGEVSNNPDAVFLTWDTLDAERASLVPRSGVPGQYIEVEGTPDWVLEIVSLSSVQKDTRHLRQAYHRAGIREYWLIDARGEQIAFQILYHAKGRYTAAPIKDGWQYSKVFARSFRLERSRGRRDLWRYRLHVHED